jgi:hypothetical protein
MYVLTKAPGKSESRNYPKLLATALGEEPWSAGDPRWFEAPGVSPADGAPRTRAPDRPMPGDGAEADARPGTAVVEAWRVPRRAAQRPSAARAGWVEAAELLDVAADAGLAFGREVHGLLARIERGREIPWLEWRASGAGEGALEMAARCVRAPALAEVWELPAAAEVWREREFEVVIEGAWVSGIFDRVVVVRAPDGRAEAATVFDFKTDRVRETGDIDRVRARHAAQLALYRSAAARLAGLPERAVRCRLVCTGPAVVVDAIAP